jgi:DNA (cytosine-5)-methyltransferase 1
LHNRQFAVIDIFAGAGGLGEGFAKFEHKSVSPFDLVLSIEREDVISKTLLLREVWRQSGNRWSSFSTSSAGEELFDQIAEGCPGEVEKARKKVLCAELGKTPSKLIDARIREALYRRNPHWVLVGGPPCQAYSLAGRSRMGSTNADFVQDERHFLYKEYLRIVATHKPAVFVIENVPGILSSRINGEFIFGKILEDLRNPTFAVFGEVDKHVTYRLYNLSPGGTEELFKADRSESFVVSSEDFGVPQRRRRVLVVGVRSDLDRAPEKFTKARHVTTVQDVIGNLPKIRSKLSKEPDSWGGWCSALSEIQRMRWMTTRRASELAPVVELIRTTLVDRRTPLETSAAYANGQRNPSSFRDSRLDGWYEPAHITLSSHQSRSHMRTDLHRYLFASAYTKIFGRSPTLRDFPEELRPNHVNVSEAVSSGMFGDRFRVQRCDAPATTITSHIAKDGHYYIHYDPAQCRSLTIREAARIQTFPDNYIFFGNRTQQYHQIGNAVPPLLAIMVARSVWTVLS